jgi:hypothetical protein
VDDHPEVVVVVRQPRPPRRHSSYLLERLAREAKKTPRQFLLDGLRRYGSYGYFADSLWVSRQTVVTWCQRHNIQLVYEEEAS